MSDEEKFNDMIDTDKKLYENIVKIKLLIDQARAIADKKGYNEFAIIYNSEIQDYFYRLHQNENNYLDLLTQYNQRQEDYRTNQAYSLSKWIDSKTNQVIEFFKGLWNYGFSGLGALPLLLPIVIVAGAVISVGVIAYFLTKYYSSVGYQYNKSLETYSDLSKTNPIEADKMLVSIDKEAEKALEAQTQIEKDSSQSSLGSQIGKGIMWGTIILALLWGGSEIINNKNK